MNTPSYSERLLRNITRRQTLLETIRNHCTDGVNNALYQSVKPIKVAKTFEKFLQTVEKKRVYTKLDEEGKRATYQKLFMILNRSADLSDKKEISTASVSSLFSR